MDNRENNRNAKFHLWGWILFLVCAGLFITSSLQTGDLLALAASIVFFIACVVFIIPLVGSGNLKQKR
jgi:predicted membrane channel-forming protein YqfA (hemolysin III family)